MASAKANQVEPFAHMRDLLVQLSGHSPPQRYSLTLGSAHLLKLAAAGQGSWATRRYKIKNLRFDGDAGL
jgi:hypothetical protein